MGLKFFDSMSVSTSEIARLGTSYSALLSNFGLQATLPFSIHFNCRRGLIPMAQWSGTSDRKYLADNVAAKTSSRDLNGTNVIGTHLNGAAFNLYFRNIRTLDALDDQYGGVLVNPDGLPDNPSAFAPILRLSLSYWKKMGKKGIWLKLPLEKSDLVPIAVKEGFQYHHAEPGYLMLTHWIPEGPCMLPANASHQVGVGGFVVNDNNEVLVVQEKHCSPATLGLWKIPTGFILEAEEIYNGAVREVKEETGINTEFIEVIAFRHAHNVAFQKSDLFFICMLRPLSSNIIVDGIEIEAAKWMPLVEFVKQPQIQEDSMFMKIIDICIARMGQRYCGLSPHHMVSKFDGKSSSLYYNVMDTHQDVNCIGN
ncbi:nudix hydrolase 8 isoform X2 [Prosopis cineraria]|uniref:nudix hydrolase 8 isoform X2 n=1 Tax=Prosopis cineraria TaxID=364024 RepID=UPI00241016A3|nr:nudix hydrolase 8 isoform X2 [Prosopis cineraria]